MYAHLRFMQALADRPMLGNETTFIKFAKR